MKGFKTISMLLLTVLMVFMAACSNNSSNSGSNGSTTANDSSSAKGNNTGSSSNKQVAIEYWHTYSDAEELVMVEEIVPLFEQAYPNIKVNLTRMPYEGLKQQVIAAVAGDAAPDLMRMDIVWVPEFASQGALMEISGLNGFEQLKANLFEGPLATNQYNGGIYGLPVNTNTKVAIYNKKTLELAGLTEAPKTMEELEKAAYMLKDKGVYGIGFGGVGPWTFAPWFWSLGGDITSDDYSTVDGYLNSEASIQALEKLIEWNNAGIVVPALLGGEPGTWDGVISGEYLMIEDGPWFYSIKIGEKEQTGFDPIEETVRTVMPAGPGGSASVVGGENLVIFTNSKNSEAAWTFAQWMLTEEPQKLMAKTGLIPANIAAASSMTEMDIPFIDTYVEQLKTAYPRTPIPQWGEMEGILSLAVEKAIRGETDARTALNEAVEQIEAILK